LLSERSTIFVLRSKRSDEAFDGELKKIGLCGRTLGQINLGPKDILKGTSKSIKWYMECSIPLEEWPVMNRNQEISVVHPVSRWVVPLEQFYWVCHWLPGLPCTGWWDCHRGESSGIRLKCKQTSSYECSLSWLTRGAQATTNKTTTTQEESIWVRPRLANILREKLVNALGKHCKI